jgi:hypothetical protein
MAFTDAYRCQNDSLIRVPPLVAMEARPPSNHRTVEGQS